MVLLMLANLYGCTGTQSFGTAARPGDTVSLMVGYYPNYSREDFSLNFYDASFNLLDTIPAGDPRIRAYVHTYPDPLSKVVIGYETNQDITPDFPGNNSSPQTESNWGYLMSVGADNSKEWFQNMMIVDLPTSLAPGTVSIVISTPAEPFLALQAIDILSGTGTPNTFGATGSGSLPDGQFQSLERAEHFKVSFSGSTVPHAIEIDMTRDTGVGVAHVVNPRGDIKSINWTDDGTKLKVILMPAKNATLTDINDFKFYVAGEITGLQLDSGVTIPVKGFAADGSDITVSAIITAQ